MDDRKSKEGRDSDSPAAGPTSIFLGKEHKQVDWLVCLFAPVSLCVYLLLRLRNCVCLSCFYFLRAIHPRPICLPISVSVTGFVFVRLPHLSLRLLIYLTVSASSCLSSCVYMWLCLYLCLIYSFCVYLGRSLLSPTPFLPSRRQPRDLPMEAPSKSTDCLISLLINDAVRLHSFQVQRKIISASAVGPTPPGGAIVCSFVYSTLGSWD